MRHAGHVSGDSVSHRSQVKERDAGGLGRQRRTDLAAARRCHHGETEGGPQVPVTDEEVHHHVLPILSLDPTPQDQCLTWTNKYRHGVTNHYGQTCRVNNTMSDENWCQTGLEVECQTNIGFPA